MPVMTFKVTAEEARRIRARARALKAPSVSAYLRQAALPPAPPMERVLAVDPLTGILVDHTSGPEISMEAIRAALQDFP